MKNDESGSWFSKLHILTEIFGLQSPHDIILNPPTKISWNKLVNNCSNSLFLQKLKIGSARKVNPKVHQFQ